MGQKASKPVAQGDASKPQQDSAPASNPQPAAITRPGSKDESRDRVLPKPVERPIAAIPGVKAQLNKDALGLTSAASERRPDEKSKAGLPSGLQVKETPKTSAEISKPSVLQRTPATSVQKQPVPIQQTNAPLPRSQPASSSAVSKPISQQPATQQAQSLTPAKQVQPSPSKQSTPQQPVQKLALQKGSTQKVPPAKQTVQQKQRQTPPVKQTFQHKQPQPPVPKQQQIPQQKLQQLQASLPKQPPSGEQKPPSQVFQAHTADAPRQHNTQPQHTAKLSNQDSASVKQTPHPPDQSKASKPPKKKKQKQAKPAPPSIAPNPNASKGQRKPIPAPHDEPAIPSGGGPLRSRMSSPPKLVVTGATPASQAASAASGSTGPVNAKVGEKRRLPEEGIPTNSTTAVTSTGSPPDRQHKIVRRDGDVDTASAKEGAAGKAITAPPVAEEKEEGEISDEEMDQAPVPSLPSASRTSLLDRIGDSVYAAPSGPSAPFAGSLSARMNPALMSRIDTRGPAHGQSAGFHSAPYPVRLPPRAMKAVVQSEVRPSNVVSAPTASSSKQQTNGVVSMKEVEQPRKKGVIGRSGNQTTVNGVAIPAPKGQGEGQLDEAGQRELIEIIVELHNKGISTAQLTQRGVPTQLINKVMRALARPAPSIDRKSERKVVPASTGSARRASQTVSQLDPTTAAFTPMQVDGGNEVDMDIDIDSENEQAPHTESQVSHMPLQSVQAIPSASMAWMPMPSFLPTMPMPISMPFPQPPPPPPAVPAQPPPPPMEPKLSLKELKARLLANRKIKERALVADTPEVSDLDTPTLSHLTTTASVLPPTVATDMQESLEQPSRPPSPPNMVTSTSTQSVASRTESPSIPSPQISATTPAAIPVNSRRPGAADFVDVPPSRLASSTFFRSNVRRTFAPPQPKRLVVDLDDTSDDSDSDEEFDPDRDMSLPVDPEPDHATALRLMHEAELRIALERKKAQLLENRAKIAAYAARKKAAALLPSNTETAATPSPSMVPTGLALAVPSETDKMSVSPTISRASVESPEIPEAAAATPAEINNTGGMEAKPDAGKKSTQKFIAKDKASCEPECTRHSPLARDGQTSNALLPSQGCLYLKSSLACLAETVTPTTAMIDLTQEEEPVSHFPVRSAGMPECAHLPVTDHIERGVGFSMFPVVAEIWRLSIGWAAQAHFKPYQFFTPHPLTSDPSKTKTSADVLDLDQLKNISLSRMMREHRASSGKAEQDPVVCKYELRGGACNLPDCPDFHMRREIVASQQDLLRYIDMVIPVKRSSPQTVITAREHLQQLILSKPDVPPKLAESGPLDMAIESSKDAAIREKAQKIKLIKQRKAALLYQARKSDVEEFLHELRKTMHDFSAAADVTDR